VTDGQPAATSSLTVKQAADELQVTPATVRRRRSRPARQGPIRANVCAMVIVSPTGLAQNSSSASVMEPTTKRSKQ